MRDNNFYERLNQIRSKYGYINENQSHNYNVGYPPSRPQTTITNYPINLPQKNNYSHHNPSRSPVGKIQKTDYFNAHQVTRVTPTNNYLKERSQHSISMRQQPIQDYKQFQRSRNELNMQNDKYAFSKTKTTIKPNNIAEVSSPSPIKKLGDLSYRTSPYKNKQYGQPLTPSNGIKRNNEVTTNRTQKESYRNEKETIRKERESYRTNNTTKQNNEAIMQYKRKTQEQHPTSKRHQISFQNINIDTPRSCFESNETMTDRISLAEFNNRNMNLSQKFSFNVNNIQKIQDKINSALNKQK